MIQNWKATVLGTTVSAPADSNMQEVCEKAEN